MTIISCNRRDCVWCLCGENACVNTSVRITADGCQDYDTVLERADYHETFWIAVKRADGQVYRAERMGKRIEYKGRVFYTVEQTDERGAFIVTDAITGAEVGTFGRVKKMWKAFLAAAARYPDVMSYPELFSDGEQEQEEKPPVISNAEFTGILDDLKKMYGGGV